MSRSTKRRKESGISCDIDSHPVFIRAVNEARGNREGNNAFYNKSSTDPLNSLPASGASSSFAGASKKRSGSNSHTSPKDIMLYRILADTSVTPETMDYLMMESKKFKDPITMYGVYEAAAAGNKAMVEHVVEVLQNGYGFNHLHAEVLKVRFIYSLVWEIFTPSLLIRHKLSEGASLTSYRKNQILKKATGNYSITPLEYVTAIVLPLNLEKKNSADSRRLAAINPNPTFLKELCEALTPAETTEQDERGRTALHFAAACSDPAPLEYLLSKGMDPMREDFNRLTPLLLASKYGVLQYMRCRLAVRLYADMGCIIQAVKIIFRFLLTPWEVDRMLQIIRCSRMAIGRCILPRIMDMRKRSR